MSQFKNFSETIYCQVAPVTYDRRVWLERKTVSEDEICAYVNDHCFEAGESYYDFLRIEARDVAGLSDKILRELYKRGFSTKDFVLVDDGNVRLDYSFLDDEPWAARRSVQAIVYGDITAEDDYRRENDKPGTWLTYTQLVREVGHNRSHKIFEALQNQPH